MDVRYELIQDDMVVAGCAGHNAEKEIQHYAMMYGQDGPVEMVKVVRSKFEPDNVSEQPYLAASMHIKTIEMQQEIIAKQNRRIAIYEAGFNEMLAYGEDENGIAKKCLEKAKEIK